MPQHRIYRMKFSGVYPMYIQKAERKNRTKEEVDQVICWLVLPLSVVDNSVLVFRRLRGSLSHESGISAHLSAPHAASHSSTLVHLPAHSPAFPASTCTARRWRERKRQHLANAPAPSCQSGSHCRCPLPIALRHTLATSVDGLRQHHTQ